MFTDNLFVVYINWEKYILAKGVKINFFFKYHNEVSSVRYTHNSENKEKNLLHALTTHVNIFN